MAALPPELRLISSLFMPYALTKRDELEKSDGRFAHYTTADTAMKILTSKKVWMRNAITMNDFSEIAYGKNCLLPAYNNEQIGGRLRSFLNNIFPGFTTELEGRFNSWLPHFELNTFLVSLSEHDREEDTLGRLSMWRAYGPKNGVALILKNTPFVTVTDKLKAYSSPVSYLTPDQFAHAFSATIDTIVANEALIRSLSKDVVLGSTFVMLKFALLCTKHPGFAEEREWRIIYSPTQDKSQIIEEAFESIGGVPQEVHKIPLINSDENELHARIPDILDRIIIGPSTQPLSIRNAFLGLLRDAGVSNPEQRIYYSDIPLRTY